MMDEVVLRPGMTFEPNPAMRTYRIRCEPDDEVERLRAENERLRAIAGYGDENTRVQSMELATEITHLRAAVTRVREAINGADIYTEFGVADLQHFLGEAQ